jgi:predicted nucleic acid-binding protein
MDMKGHPKKKGRAGGVKRKRAGASPGRSRAINEALRAWVTRKRRKNAVKEMDTLRTAVPKASSEEVARRFPGRAQAWLPALMRFALEEVPASKPWLRKTLELVQLHDVTFYDAAYHALAIVNGGTFVTADSRYATKTANSG